MKAYYITRTLKQEFLAFGNNKEEAIENSYNNEFDFRFLNYDDFSVNGEVIGGNATAKVINDIVVVNQRSINQNNIKELQELVDAGANILIKDDEGNLKIIEKS